MFIMLRMVSIEAYEEKDENDSLVDAQNFTIGSKVYKISQKWDSPISKQN